MAQCPSPDRNKPIRLQTLEQAGEFISTEVL